MTGFADPDQWGGSALTPSVLTNTSSNYAARPEQRGGFDVSVIGTNDFLALLRGLRTAMIRKHVKFTEQDLIEYATQLWQDQDAHDLLSQVVQQERAKHPELASIAGALDLAISNTLAGQLDYELFNQDGMFADQGLDILRAGGGKLSTAQRKLALGVDQRAFLPFDPQFLRISGFAYGEQLTVGSVSGTNPGVDLGLPEGTELIAPFAGVVRNVSGGARGNAIELTFGNGYKMIFNHLSQVALPDGAEVGAGMLLGYSGQTGNAFGAHLNLELHTPDGRTIDPMGLLGQLDSGVTISELEASFGKGLESALAAGKQYKTAATQYMTPGERAAWERTQPSHIAGMLAGQYQDWSSLINQESQRIFGHNGNDGIIKELFDANGGLANKAAVTRFYDMLDWHPEREPKALAVNVPSGTGRPYPYGQRGGPGGDKKKGPSGGGGPPGSPDPRNPDIGYIE
jgi:murein DD-endopeptidase MepM/ murein hydrolase activator NlpD